MSRFFLVLSVAVASGCSGQIGDSQAPPPADPADTPPPEIEPPSVADTARWAELPNTSPGGIRRLTNAEIEATVTDLLGQAIGFTEGFPPEERVGGFENNAAALTFPPTLSERAFDAARRVGDIVAASPDRFASCAISERNRVCGETVVRNFAERAWRRSPNDADLTRLLASYGVGFEQSGFELGVTLAVQATLLSAS
ncbi:MAG: DUF1587 domain-containing protein, partial [Myxococcota bacterium]